MNLRNDGRKRNEYRPMELETEVVTHASGSARLRLANTDILVGVKAEIDVPNVEAPSIGKIEFFVDWFVCLLIVQDGESWFSPISFVFFVVPLMQPLLLKAEVVKI